MSDEDDYLLYEEQEDEILTAGALIIRYGSIAKAEQEIASTFKIDPAQAQDVVAEAGIGLINAAPPELRRSFEAVCSFHRWNHIYEYASRTGRLKDAMDAQKQLDALLRSVH
jgi:hypothetical protein